MLTAQWFEGQNEFYYLAYHVWLRDHKSSPCMVKGSQEFQVVWLGFLGVFDFWAFLNLGLGLNMCPKVPINRCL